MSLEKPVFVYMSFGLVIENLGWLASDGVESAIVEIVPHNVEGVLFLHLFN